MLSAVSGPRGSGSAIVATSLIGIEACANSRTRRAQIDRWRRAPYHPIPTACQGGRRPCGDFEPMAYEDGADRDDRLRLAGTSREQSRNHGPVRPALHGFNAARTANMGGRGATSVRSESAHIGVLIALVLRWCTCGGTHKRKTTPIGRWSRAGRRGGTCSSLVIG